ncbi:hypothetical protein DEO23_07240 [Brachybacterium endophyticum]|uniref:Activator of Hsp90 ATPase homologue 1/2-like C-terminal domain-containing protein n=1 Tax=Brachybacterium endophyticum TaxID=2182385 RepID=A0A2U2RLQ5_9MICO|nr:SRPBCC family protein [Brachybacterium endophyticum]PWH06714.1 hypothetical protein DEO23_07240 [Brachybacterium endophyticum]
MGTHLVTRSLLGTARAPEMVLRRHVSAAPSAVREALVDPERRSRWLGDVEGDPSGPGDSFELRLGDDASDAAVGRLLMLEADHLALAWSWQGERDSMIHARVRPDGEGAAIWLRHTLTEPDHVEGYGGGWEQLLQALARELGCEAAEAADDAAIETAAAERWHLMTERPLEVVRDLPVPAERVWEAFTSSEGLGSWWWKHWEDVTVSLDTENGSYRIDAPRIGTSIRGQRLVAEQPSRLAATWVWADQDGTAVDEAIDLHLTAGGDGAGTRLTLRHTGPWAEDSLPENYRQGWDASLDQLSEVLRG